MSESKHKIPQAKLVFEDYFDGKELDSTKWKKCPGWIRQGKSLWRDDMSYLDGEGHLVLRMEWDEEAQLVNCGAVWTKDLFEYGYGYYEASIKFTPHRGAWGAFWMMVGDVGSVINGAADGVEIDILETHEFAKGGYHHTLHWDGYADHHKYYYPTMLNMINAYDDKFHTFGLLRSEEGYHFYVDNQLSAFASVQDCAACPLDGHMLLTCEAAAWHGAGTPESIADMPAEMIVDYVRVYDSLPF